MQGETKSLQLWLSMYEYYYLALAYGINICLVYDYVLIV